jgi:vanadium chloroperoxidase
MIMLILPPAEEPPGLNAFPVLYWNHVGLEMNRITHSLGGPQTGPTMSSRALGLLHLAMHDAYFAVLGHNQTSTPPDYPTYLPDAERPAVPAGVSQSFGDANEALSAAAIRMITRLYAPTPAMSVGAGDTMRLLRDQMIKQYASPATNHAARGFGVSIADAIFDRLAVKPGEIGAGAGDYQPRPGRHRFRDEPVNPVRHVPIDPDDPAKGTRAVRVYHGPFYGTSVADFAVTDPDGHAIATWPETDYAEALGEVVRLGGAPGLRSTRRRPDETVAAYFWAYDGANLIGTPPRLYNQILRVVAWEQRGPSASEQEQTSEFVRLFALANAAMADAGKYAWKEKYKFELWRPLSGVREHDTGSGDAPDNPQGNPEIDADADPFWTTLGAPETNTHLISFKPPFPAYPSGHATFGAACFQMARLFYHDRDNLTFDTNGADTIGFSFVSEELNGISRDLHQPFDPSRPIEDQPGTVRTRVRRRFPSLWHAIFENAFSRIYLGVHWRFDAADADDIKRQNNRNENKTPVNITYSHVWTQKRTPGDTLPIGGVPLGLGIANDIYANRMRAPEPQPSPVVAQADIAAPA